MRFAKRIDKRTSGSKWREYAVKVIDKARAQEGQWLPLIKREVAVMQGAHGRNQRHGFAGGTKPGDCPAQNRNAPRDRNF